MIPCMIGEIGFIGYPPFALELERLAFWFTRDAIGQGVRQLLDSRNCLDERTGDVIDGLLWKAPFRQHEKSLNAGDKKKGVLIALGR